LEGDLRQGEERSEGKGKGNVEEKRREERPEGFLGDESALVWWPCED
jgi:hypothetical protein